MIFITTGICLPRLIYVRKWMRPVRFESNRTEIVLSGALSGSFYRLQILSGSYSSDPDISL